MSKIYPWTRRCTDLNKQSNTRPDPRGKQNITQNAKEDKIIENRRIAVEITHEEDDLDFYSESDYGYQSYV